MAIVNCCCCGKQIVNYNVGVRDEYCAPALGSVHMGPSLGVCCGYCSKDLDEWGLFPEERHLIPDLYH